MDMSLYMKVSEYGYISAYKGLCISRDTSLCKEVSIPISIHTYNTYIYVKETYDRI